MQKQGETRLDLVQKNTEIFKDIIPKIASQNPGIILVILNLNGISKHIPINLFRTFAVILEIYWEYRFHLIASGPFRR